MFTVKKSSIILLIRERFIPDLMSLMNSENTLSRCDAGADVSVLDFACGTGRFYDCIVDILDKEYAIPPEKVF